MTQAKGPHGLLWLLLLCVAACVCACGGGSEEGVAANAVPVFSFVVLADPHLYGDPDAEARLERCVQWIEEHADGRAIELVFVAGDIGSRLDAAQTVLEGLSVPYIPVLGDNNVQSGREATYEAAFASHHVALSSFLENWHQAPSPVANPDAGGSSHLQNLAFDHRGVHFVGLDWCTRRTGGGLDGEQADLHDFPGGTLPFLAKELAQCPKGRLENVVLVSHHPMHDFALGAGAFSAAEMGAIEVLTAPYAQTVYADFAGHYHFDWHDADAGGGFEVFVTDATHDDVITLRVVRVLDDGVSFHYEHELVVLDAAP